MEEFTQRPKSDLREKAELDTFYRGFIENVKEFGAKNPAEVTGEQVDVLYSALMKEKSSWAGSHVLGSIANDLAVLKKEFAKEVLIGR